METKTFKYFPTQLNMSVLENGLTVFNAHKPSKIIEASLVFAAGSLDDEHPGTAHFLEHMLL